jgi:sugar phosphate permease
MNTANADDAALKKSAYRKASLRILPLLALGYGAAYIDRVNISFASLQMNRDLNFSATVYGFGAVRHCVTDASGCSASSISACSVVATPTPSSRPISFRRFQAPASLVRGSSLRPCT